MSEQGKESFKPLFTNPLETYPGLTINDLNRYLPAVQTVDDISMTSEQMKEGLFLANCLDGLQKLPDKSIDLVIAEPPKDPWDGIDDRGGRMTLQEYYQWNEKWLDESYRVLKNTGGLYLLCGWQVSGMYHGLLSDHFMVQTRITWRNKQGKVQPRIPTWRNEIGDIWFVTKSEDFLFNLRAVNLESDRKKMISESESKSQTNFWIDIPYITDEAGRRSGKLYSKILDASSFKLNWVLDPFMRNGDAGVASKRCGRRFIGFETNKDLLLLSMKRIDQEG